MQWSEPVTTVKGVGPKTADILAKLDIYTVQDLLYHKPVYYKDLSNVTPIYMLQEETFAVVKAVVMSPPKWIRRDKRFSLFTFSVSDGTGYLNINIFNLPFMFKNYQMGKEYVFMAKVKAFRSRLQMDNPEVLPGNTPLGMLAYYPLTAGISQNAMRQMIKHALQAAEITETYSPAFLAENDLCANREELQWMHQPDSPQALSRAKRSLAIKELMIFLQLMKETAQKPIPSEPLEIGEECLAEYLKKLPFQCTGAQLKAMREIQQDLRQPIAANRLIQGDVGSGKTAVALFAAYAALSSGGQVLILAPTGLLAEQHYRASYQLFGDKVALLTGATTAKERTALNMQLKDGKVKLLISTHAILYEDLDFSSLKVMVIDEQHRFGVIQRSHMMEKYPGLHKFTMSATPIPRSLAMILNGSAAISVLDEMPPGRTPIKTYVLRENKRKDMYRWIFERVLKQGEKAYIVCPLLEPSEGLDAPSVCAVYEELKTAFPLAKIGCLYGKMPAKEKNTVMEQFKNGQLSVVVSTTVVEVGVDVTDATVMVIENADRFGLAQLHQLRGRVGRGQKESYCYLLSDGSGLERLNVLKECNDGFEIAKKDLALRGAGDFFGTQQHGEMSFFFVDLLQDIGLFEQVKIILDNVKTNHPEDYKILNEQIELKLQTQKQQYIAV